MRISMLESKIIICQYINSKMFNCRELLGIVIGNVINWLS